MGNVQTFNSNFSYHTAVTPPSNGSTSVYRAASHPDALIESLLDRKIGSTYELFEASCQRYPNRRFLGRRFRDSSGQLGGYTWMTFKESQTIALAFGTSMIRENLIPLQEFPDETYEGARSLRILGLYAKNCVEWFLAEQACNAYGLTLCPLYDTLGDEAIEFILKQSRMATILVAFGCLPNLVRVLADCQKNGRTEDLMLTTAILIDPSNPEEPTTLGQQFKEAVEMGAKVNLKILIWHELVAHGNDPLPPAKIDPELVATLCYTSGTTGMPKGVMLSHKMITAVVIGGIRGPISTAGYFEVGHEDTVLSYLPLAHVFERCVCNIVIAKAGAIGVYSGDMAKLLDDIKFLRPTVFVSVPRLFNRINDKVAMSLNEKKLPLQLMFNQGLNSKIMRRRNDSTTTHKVWDAVVFAKIRAMMGGKLRGMISGGAPLDPVVLERMTAFFSAPLMQGYGLSETFGPCFLMHPEDPVAGFIGGVWPAVEFKLTSVPEMGYLVTKIPPQGELMLRGPGVSPGYFRNAQETAAAWDKDGWFHTGDICTMNTQTGAVMIIDRKKNIFKLAQGEYVAPEKIEAIYGQSVYVNQIFVFGYSDKPVLVAIVVPDVEIAVKWAEKNHVDDCDMTSLCGHPELKKQITLDMERVAKTNNLKGFEKVKNIYLAAEPFSVENNLLTPTSKIKRHECKQKFQSRIDKLYEELEQTTQQQQQQNGFSR